MNRIVAVNDLILLKEGNTPRPVGLLARAKVRAVRLQTAKNSYVRPITMI